MYLHGALAVYFIMSHSSCRESRPCDCLNFKELIAPNRSNIWNLGGYNGIRTHNHLVHKWTLNHLARLAKWLSCVVRAYLYSTSTVWFHHITNLFRVNARTRHGILNFRDCSRTQVRSSLIFSQLQSVDSL